MGKQKKGERILQEILENDRNCEIYEVWRNLATMYGRQKKHEEVGYFYRFLVCIIVSKTCIYKLCFAKKNCTSFFRLSVSAQKLCG